MSQIARPEGIEPGDYEAIQAAVAATVRGRWFLDEYARRCRSDEIGQVLDAVGRLEKAVTRPPETPPSDRLLLQRVQEIAEHLRLLAFDIGAHDLPLDLGARLESAVRAVAALAPREANTAARAELPQPPASDRVDPAALAAWDALPITAKLALFV